MPKKQSLEESSKKEAHAILREDKPISPVEQAAVAALDQHRWVLWHANDYSLGVILLLSRAGLLRDKAHEQEMDKADASEARLVTEKRMKDAISISTLSDAMSQAAGRLEGGAEPAEVAAWLQKIRDLAMETRDRRAPDGGA